MSLEGYHSDLWQHFNFNPERLKKMQSGADILKNFIRLILNQGLLQSDLFSKENLTELSTRLIDTQIPTASRRIKSLVDISVDQNSLPLIRYELRFLAHIAKYLEEFEQLTLPAKLELWQVCGAAIPKETVLKQPPIEDQWILRSIEMSREDSLTTRKIWYHGLENDQWLFTLDYAFGNQKLEEAKPKYSRIGGKAFVYPGLSPGRMILIENGYITRKPSEHQKFETILELKAYLASIYTSNVFVQEVPFTLKNVLLIHQSEKFLLVDSVNEMLQISLHIRENGLDHSEKLWSKIANSGGKPFEINLIYSKAQFYLL